MKKLKVLKNRILRTVSMLCVLVTLFCAGTISAQADEITGYTVYNLLEANEYALYLDGQYHTVLDVPRTWLTNVSSCKLDFTVPWLQRLDSIVLTVATYTIPSSLVLNNIQGELVGSFYDSENYFISQWFFDLSSTNIAFYGSLNLNFSWSTTYNGNLNVLSLCGYFDAISRIHNFDARLQAAQITEQGDLYLEDVGSENNVSVPYIYSYEGNFVSVTFAYGYLSLYIRPDDRVYDFADKLSLLMTSIGSTSFGAYLVEGSYDDFVTDIPLVSKEVTSSYGGVLTHEDMEWKLNQYLVEFDLSGYDLQDKTIVIDCHIEPMDSDDFSGQREMLYGSVLGLTMTPEVAEVPWYLDFSRWLKGQYNSITAAVSNAAADISSSIGSFSSSVGTHFSNLSTWISNQTSALTSSLSTNFTNLSSWISSQTTSLSNSLTAVKDAVNTWGFNVRSAIIAWGTNIFNAINDRVSSLEGTVEVFANNVRDYFDSLKNHLTSLLNPDPDAGEDFKEDSQNNAAILGGLNDQMNSVVKPDLSGSGNISGIITPSQMSSYTTVLATVVNAPYIGQVVMLSLILSLAGYVLFGKR